MAGQITFSDALSSEIRQVIDMHAQELGDELDGVEEVVGDHLSQKAYEEWRRLTDLHGFNTLTKAVKKKYL